MTVKEIKSNELVVMTPELYQEFAQGGCVPACHLTYNWINIGDKFKLANVPNWKKVGRFIDREANIDVMLAENSSVKEYNKKMKAYLDNEAKENLGRTGCFRIEGKIVP